MVIDTAGNPIKEPSPWCSWCLGPADTSGRCANGCENGVAVVAASTVDTRDKRIVELCRQCAREELEQARIDRDEAISQAVSIGRESKKLEAEVERLRYIIEATAQTLNAIGWPDAANDLRSSALRGGGESNVVTEGSTTYVRSLSAPAQPEEVPLDSPDHRPKELDEFAARGFERINRGLRGGGK